MCITYTKGACLGRQEFLELIITSDNPRGPLEDGTARERGSEVSVTFSVQVHPEGLRTPGRPDNLYTTINHVMGSCSSSSNILQPSHERVHLLKENGLGDDEVRRTFRILVFYFSIMAIQC